jgi:triosephosphate isomerase
MIPYVVAGNWKMYKDLSSGAALIEGIRDGLGPAPLEAGLEVIVAPPFPLLDTARRLLTGSAVALAAQNMHEEDEGAFTGEVSAGMLLSAGATRVILGHSERRQYFHESDALVNRKAKKALERDLRPIICVGETLAEREAGRTTEVVTAQVRGVLAGFGAADLDRCILAYEPVWAIGTGRTATPEQAQEVHALIRSLVADLAGMGAAERIVIQYGGSVKADNALDLFLQPDINGGLIGGASLKPESFLAIVAAARSALGALRH